MPLDSTSTAVANTAYDIASHPLWLLEVQMEREMLEVGADSFRETVSKARSKGQMTNLKPVRRLLDEWVPQMAAGIREWRRHSAKRRGVRPLALGYIQDADAEVLSLIALRAVLRAIGTAKGSKVLNLAITIGQCAEHELQVRAWERQDPDSFRSAQRYFDREGSAASHRAKANLFLFHRDLAAGRFEEGWVAWPREVHFRVGVALIEVLIRHTGWFTVEEDSSIRAAAARKHAHHRLPLVISPKPGLLEWLTEELDHAEASCPLYMPTVIPPKPWEGTRAGGYWTPYVRTPALIRFKASQRQQREAAREEYAAIDMPEVYDAVNFLQGCAWRIDRRMLALLHAARDIDMGIGNLPVRSEKPLPPRPADIATNHEARRAWRKAAKPIKRHNNSRYGRAKMVSDILKVADAYAQHDRFYFPHMLDFRGRAYSIPSGLSPQGHDVARGLLKFAAAEPILPENGGATWLALHLAGTMGHDKVPNAERLAWVDARRDDWLRVDKDPMAALDVWSAGVKKPWQALAAILEWAGYLKEGDGFMSSLPVMVDGTCNGLQHLSAILRDREGAALVNLTDSGAPRDIYEEIAAEWHETLGAIADGGGEEGKLAASWLAWAGPAARASTKRQVMVLPYGGTKDAFFTYTRQYLDEIYPMGDASGDHEAESYRTKVLGLAVKHLWAIVNVRLKGAMQVMTWLRECARLVAEGNQPIYWVAPSGFVVRHFYGLQKEKRIKLYLDGTRHDLQVFEITKDLDVRHQVQGVPPNFIHSLDAAALAITANGCLARGITHMTAIHDAYGTHAAHMGKLSDLLREAFVAVHDRDVLGIFWAGCEDILATLYRSRGATPEEALAAARAKRPPLPEAGTLDIREVLRSPYFFS